MESKWRQDYARRGRTNNAFKLGTIMMCGKFWVRPDGCQTVYRGQDSEIAADEIQAVAGYGATSITVPNQDMPAGTIWTFGVAKVSHCGLESDMTTCQIRIADSGEAFGAAPNAPRDLRATLLAGGLVRLNWRYDKLGEAVSVSAYHIYMDSGSGFDFTGDPLGSTSRNQLKYTTEALTHGQTYRFCVRSASSAGDESQNIDTVTVVPDSVGPTAITGITATVTEI